MQELAGKVAVVTGAANGIGRAMAQVFAEQGMHVMLADIEAPLLEAATRELRDQGFSVACQVTDVGDGAAVEALAQATESTFGAMHIACSNAGVYTGGQLWEATLEDYQWLINVNQWGVIHGIRSFVPRMLKHGEPAHLVNTASMAAVTTLPYAGVYHMTKHAVLALSECLYHELSLAAPQVGVSCLCPELVNTGIAQAERNRPTALSATAETDTHKLAMDAIRDSTAKGVTPRLLAERTLAAIRARQFYILAEDAWRDCANQRLEDLRLGQNPTLKPPALDF